MILASVMSWHCDTPLLRVLVVPLWPEWPPSCRCIEQDSVCCHSTTSRRSHPQQLSRTVKLSCCSKNHCVSNLYQSSSPCDKWQTRMTGLWLAGLQEGRDASLAALDAWVFLRTSSSVRTSGSTSNLTSSWRRSLPTARFIRCQPWLLTSLGSRSKDIAEDDYLHVSFANLGVCLTWGGVWRKSSLLYEVGFDLMIHGLRQGRDCVVFLPKRPWLVMLAILLNV